MPPSLRTLSSPGEMATLLRETAPAQCELRVCVCPHIKQLCKPGGLAALRTLPEVCPVRLFCWLWRRARGLCTSKVREGFGCSEPGTPGIPTSAPCEPGPCCEPTWPSPFPQLHPKPTTGTRAAGPKSRPGRSKHLFPSAPCASSLYWMCFLMGNGQGAMLAYASCTWCKAPRFYFRSLNLENRSYIGVFSRALVQVWFNNWKVRGDPEATREEKS